MKIYHTACPRNCYSTCSLDVHVDDNRIVRIEGNQANPSSPKWGCLRGFSYTERQVSENRIRVPHLKSGKGGQFKPVSWETAFSIMVDKLSDYKERYGAQSIFYFAGSGTKGLLNAVGRSFWRLYGGFTSTYGDLCWPAGLEATRLTLGKNIHSHPRDLENSKLILLWGKNPAETNIHQMNSIYRAVEKGANLIVVDPRRTMSSGMASLLVQPRPGTDGALALGIANILLEEEKVDLDFIRTHVLGYEAFRESLRSFTPEKASDISDVPVKDIRLLARLLRDTKPATFIPGFGMQRYSNSGQTVRAILALAVLTGNIGKTGAGWYYANLQSYIFDDVLDPVASFPPEHPDGIARISVSTARLGTDMLAQTDPPLKMGWFERGNPLIQNPDSNRVAEAFGRLDFKLVIDQFFTDTAKAADLVLPSKTLFEQSDIIGSYWHPYILLKPKILEPPADVKPESEIYRVLAIKLGLDANEPDFNRIFPESDDRSIENYLSLRLAGHKGISLDELKRGPVLAPGSVEIAFSDHRFDTPSGKIELYSEEANRRWGVDPLPTYSEPVESRGSGEFSGRYPLQLLTPNTKNRTHSQFQNLALVNQFSAAPRISIHPEDADQRNIGDGDRVRVFNGRGSIVLPAHIDFTLKRGTLSLTNGWSLDSGGSVNLLSFGRETDMGFGAAFHDNLVEIEADA